MKKYLQIASMKLQIWWLRWQIYHIRSHTMLHIVYVPICSFCYRKNIQSIKIYPSIIYMVPYHKKYFLQMRYQEGHVEYDCKKARFFGIYGDNVESWWGSQWIWIFICWLFNQGIIWPGSCTVGSYNTVSCRYNAIPSDCRKKVIIQ